MMKKEIQEIITCTEVAQQFINELYSSDPTNEAFEQIGFLNGKDIITEFIDHNEYGCALEHLLYMIHESDIIFPKEKLIVLHSIADKLKVENNYKMPNQ